ncbi:carbon storage regulator CsrA [Thioalkalivibrio sp. ALE20]|uniref:carbon storage regulator CsrA n=1 Tax=Thioalkalivibrio sp. ALE20 TaxID=545275 RepID=UPI0003636AD9|nr:carbon storage regulator CsrA [Thioalkalivibrio sp. ALE20]
MLVLSRTEGESLQIGEDIVVTVLQSKGNQVRLGIAAPEDVDIVREEIADEPHPAEGTSDRRD